MKLIPIYSAESYILWKLVIYGFIIGLIATILEILSFIMLIIVGLVYKAVEAFLASAFCAHIIAMWNAIVAFFVAYGRIFVWALSIIGLITTIYLLYRGIKIAIEWLVDKFYDIKYALFRR